MGLRINEGKTKSIEVTIGQQMFKVMNYESEWVNEFKYLGTLVTNSNGITAEINHGIGIASHCYPGPKDMLKSRYVKSETNEKLYNTILKPVLI
jgi:hypothetical protein